MVTYRNTRTGRLVELDHPDPAMERAKKWQRAETGPDRIDVTPIDAEPGTETVPGAPEPAEPKPSEVRAWAREQGIDVNARGALPAELIERYKAAHEEVR